MGKYDPKEFGAKCDVCPLRNKRPVPPETSLTPLEVISGAGIAIVGEAPGQEEEKNGRPFCGPSGTELETALRTAGIRRSQTLVTNVILCRPENNDMKAMLDKIRKYNREEEKKASAESRQPEYMLNPIECCIPRLENDLTGFSSFITLGGTATRAVTGVTASIMGIRGSMMHLPGGETQRQKDVMPTIHPAFVLRQPRWRHVFRNDLQKAGRWFRGEAEWKPPETVYNPSADELKQFLYSQACPSFDLETDGIECLTAKIRCIGVGVSNKVMVCGFLGKDGRRKFYPPEEETKVKQVLIDWLLDPTRPKSSWNGGYYDRIVLESQWGVTVQGNIDGIMIHRNIESELPHGLAYAVSLYAEAPAWKQDREGNKLSTSSETDEQLHEYCALDVALTNKIMPPLSEQLRLRNLVPLWRQDQKVQGICADMHTVGMYVDQAKRLEEEKRLLKRRHELLLQIRDGVGVKDFNPGSVYQMRDLLFGKWSLVPPPDLDKEALTSSGDPSTADIVLRYLLTDGTIPPERRNILKLIRYYRKVQKILGTYVTKLRYSNVALDADLGWDEEEDWIDKETRNKYGTEKMGIVNPVTGRMHPGWNAQVTTCVVPETWILTPSGLVQIGNIQGFGPAQTEQEIHGLQLHDGTSFAEVSHLQNPGVCPTFEVQTVLGLRLVGTPHHRIQVAERPKFRAQIRGGVCRGKGYPIEPNWVWRRLDELTENEYVRVPIGMNVWGTSLPELPRVPRLPPRTSAVEVYIPTVLDEDLAFFMGVYNADGSMHDSNGSFSIRISDSTGNKKKINEAEAAAVRLFGAAAVRRDKQALHITSISLASWCKALGFGRGLNEKRIPSWLLAAPKRFIIQYLYGLSLDSHLTVNGGVSLTWTYSGSHQLAEEVQMLLLNLGIPAGLSDRRTESSPNSWAVVVCGTEDVTAVCNITGQLVPAPVGQGDRVRPRYIRRGNTLWLRVVSVHRGEEKQVLDVTVPTTEQFWSNGIVSHNTGRLSSSKPINAQNFPVPLRGLVCASPGNVLVGADMDQIEVRVAASLWGIQKYLLAFNEGKDPHSMTAYMIFREEFCRAAGIEAKYFEQPGILVGTCYDDKGKFKGKGESKELRSLSKNVHFASQYKATTERAHKMIQSTEVDKDDGTTDLPYALMPLRKVREMRDRWLESVPEYEKGWQNEIDTWKRQGYLAEPVSGRRRDFLDGENPNELVNFRIQASVASLMNEAIIELSEQIPRFKWGEGTGIIAQVHDWIGLEVPEAHAEQAAKILEGCMNRKHPLIPGVEFTAKADIGKRWNEV